MPPDKIELYLREIQASPALRATWAAMKARGLPWRERYTKYARIELGGAGPRAPLPLGMDVRLDSPRAPIRAGDELGFQVLRDGQPIADLPVELVSEHQRRWASGARPTPRAACACSAAAGRPLAAARRRPARVERRPPTNGRAAS